MHPAILDRLVDSLERLSATSALPEDWILCADLDDLKYIRPITQRKWLKKAKAELTRRRIQERVDEIAEAVEIGDKLLIDILLEAFPEDIKLHPSLTDKDRERWIDAAKRAANSCVDEIDFQGSVVYFISTDDQHIKIGFTTNLRSRLRSLRTASPNQIQVLRLIPGTQEDEQEFHRRFSAHHIRGEWFKLSPEIRKFIANSERSI